jgi:hypothetical protein
MTAEHFEETLETLLSRQPFKAFTVELNTRQRYEIDHPHSIAYQDGAAVFLAPGGVPVFFDHESVNQIINSPAHSAPGRPKGKRGNGK